jgi:serine/threonine protein kinase
MDTRRAVPVGTVLDGSYRIVRVIGSGGFGITYQAEDVNIDTPVAIKEYYPFDCCDRDATMSIKPKTFDGGLFKILQEARTLARERDDHVSVKPKSNKIVDLSLFKILKEARTLARRREAYRKALDWGRSNFLQEARTLARFDHPSIVRVTRVFEANSTAYMVMRLEEGQSFEAWLNSLGRLPTQEELDSIVSPLLDALQLMHASDFLHRDIAPDNIIVRADGSPALLDFGSARRAVAEMSSTMTGTIKAAYSPYEQYLSDSRMTGIVKAGYSPYEQYSSDGRMQGAWSDLYALGGTLYRAVTGARPDDATLRVDEDQMPPASQVAGKSGYRRGFLSAIDACLKVHQLDRPRSVAQLRPLMLGHEPS